MQRIKLFLILMAAAGLAACGNPAADKPKATVAAASAGAASGPVAGGEALPVTPENSRIEFIGSKVTGSHNGGFGKFNGTVELAPDRLENSRVRVEIDMSSVTTDDERLTGHLKSADFFDVPNHPKATFISTAIKAGGAGDATHTITGDLELRGVRKAITFPATVQASAEAVSVQSEFAINRKDFNINYPGKADDLIRDEVVLKLSIKAPRAGVRAAK